LPLRIKGIPIRAIGWNSNHQHFCFKDALVHQKFSHSKWYPITPTLQDPIRIGAWNLRSRIIMAPLTRCRAGEGRVPNEFAFLGQGLDRAGHVLDWHVRVAAMLTAAYVEPTDCRFSGYLRY
jgi:hypothetical protein